MAIDTAAERAYAIGVGLSAPTVYAEPDGTITRADRWNIAWNYAPPIVLLLDVATTNAALGRVSLVEELLGRLSVSDASRG